MIRRVMKFDKQDWKHVWWLFRLMVKSFFLFRFNDAEEAWIFLKLHFTHDHTRMN
jgi:hypothetical protein